MKKEGPSIALFGTSELSVRIFDRLWADGFVPGLLITQPDRPQGRKMAVTPPPAKVWALSKNIPVIQPDTLKNIPKELAGKEWDLFIVVAYGNILPKELLDIPLHGTLNVHPSLLPKFRGPSPVRSAILEDARETGVTVMLLDEELDHGPIVAQASVETETWPPPADTLEELLGDVGGELLAETLLPWLNGDITPEEQDHAKATYSKKIKKEDALLDLSDDPYTNFLKIQAFRKWPQAYFIQKKNGKDMRIKVTDASFENGILTIEKVIPEGKREMRYADFARNKS